ncbi:MAG: MAPEG family protein [Hyphomicrobiaceae bacterium]
MRTAALYVGLFGILLIILSLRVSLIRRDARVALGDGDNEILRRRIRAHGNFVEFVPIALLLLALAEHTGMGSLFIHLFGIVLLAARISHAYGICQTEEIFIFRMFGTVATLTVIGILSLYCIWAGL